jgi:hypothetical protein
MDEILISVLVNVEPIDIGPRYIRIDVVISE